MQKSPLSTPIILYFDQRLDAVYSKRWSKYAFSLFFVQKAEKVRNVLQNLAKKFFLFAPECWLSAIIVAALFLSLFLLA